MPDRILSIFGTYDFLSKSLPGMALVASLMTLLPEGSVPFPKIPTNFLVLISILVIISLLGTLIGEVVHSLANILETVLEGIGKAIREVVLLLVRWRRWHIQPEEPMIAKPRGESSNQSWLRGNRIYHWLYEQYADSIYIVWSHRKIFRHRLTRHLDAEDLTGDPSLSEVNFAERYLIKTAINEYGMKSKDEAKAVYTVVVSELTNSDYDRGFRIQARASFCRSMWLVFTITAIGYFLAGISVHPLGIFNNYSYVLDTLNKSEILALSGIFFITSLIFAAASGTYKGLYIDYLYSEFYSLRNGEKSENSTQNGLRRGS